MSKERETIRRIRDCVHSGELGELLTPANVNRALHVDWAGTFLPKHRVGNPGQKGRPNSELFVQVGRGQYRLKLH